MAKKTAPHSVHKPASASNAVQKASLASAGFDTLTLNNHYVPARLPTGKVVGVWGHALMRRADGNIQPVQVGDEVHKGDVILTTQNGIVQLEGPGYRMARLPGLMESDQNLAAADEQFEAPAAGLDGGGSGGLLGGVRVDRIAEAVTPQNYNYDTTGTLVQPLSVLPTTVAPPTVTVDNVTTPESSGFAVFNVHLTGAAATPVTVNLALTSGTATTNDYGSTGPDNLQVSLDNGATWTNATTVTLPAGTTSVLVRTPLVNDALNEAAETFTLTATPTSGSANLATATGTATITDDDPQPNIVINDVTVNEGAGSAVFSISLSATSGQAVTVNWATVDGVAKSGSDFTAASGSITFAPGETVKTVVIPVLNDGFFEQSETFQVQLTDPTNAALAQATGTGTIKDDGTGAGGTDNDTPKLTLSGPAVIDEAAGTVTYTVTMSNAAAVPVTVHYATTDGTATAGKDYTATTGDLTFAAGELTKTIIVPITQDTLFEKSETFSVALSNPTNATLATASVTSQIVDDGRTLDNGGTANNDTPVLNITGPAIIDEAGKTATYTVTLSNASTSDVTVNFATGAATDTATANADYTLQTGTLTFAANSTAAQTITVPITNDTTFEQSETLTVALSNAQGATIGTGSVVSQIVDDGRTIPGGGTANDDRPTLSITGPAVIDEAAGTATYTVTLSAASTSAVTVHYATSDGGTSGSAATAGSDYTTTVGDLTFAAGELTKTIVVPITPDTLFEKSETFTVALSNPTNATLATASVTSQIVDDGRTLDNGSTANNDTPVLNIIGPAVIDEAAGTATYTVTLSNASTSAVTVNFATGAATDTATANADYTAQTGSLTFAANSTAAQTITVPITNDTTFEQSETLTVALSNAQGATIGTGSVVSQIVDDGRTIPGGGTANDDRPTLTLTGPAVIDEAAGTATYTVTLSAATTVPVTVHYATSDGTATASNDYTARVGDLTFAAGELTKTISVPITNDTTFEKSETFSVALSNPTNATLATASVTSQIVDDGRDLGGGKFANNDLAVTVDESALSGGNLESSSSQTTHASVTVAPSGTTGAVYAFGDLAVLQAQHYTSDGQALVWGVTTGANGTSLLLGSVANTSSSEGATSDVIRVTLTTATGAATVDLLGNLDHPAGAGANTLTVPIPLKETLGTATDSYQLAVNVVDDVPVANNQQATAVVQNTNLLIVLDTSGSMQDRANGMSGATGLQLAIKAVDQLMETYDAAGNVSITLVTFNSSSKIILTGVTSAADAVAQLNAAKLVGSDFTNYDAAISTAESAYNSAAHLSNAVNVAYFISDGKPEGPTSALTSQYALDSNEQTAWQQYLTDHDMQAYAVGIGAQLTNPNTATPFLTALGAVAYDGGNATDPSNGVMTVVDTTNLGTALVSTVPTPVTGTLLGGLIDSTSGAGADGGYLSQVVVNGHTYSFNGTGVTADSPSGYTYDASTHLLAVTTTTGTFAVSLTTGAYSFQSQVAEALNVSYTIKDQDGDTATATLTVATVQPTLLDGTTGNDTLTGQAAIVNLIDGRGGDDVIVGSNANDILYGGAGNDTLTGGLGSDVFAWRLADAPTSTTSVDTIKDFNVKPVTAGGDILDLRDLLQGETSNATTLAGYLHFDNAASGNATLHVHSGGTGSAENQTIILQGVDLSGWGSSDTQIIQSLLNQGKLLVDGH